MDAVSVEAARFASRRSGVHTARVKPLRNPADLLDAALIPAAALPALERVAARYAVAVTPAFAALIDPADPRDPIALQMLPQPFELETTAEERADPIGDAAHSPTPGIVHRYPDRVLLKLTHTCAVYCRFCFRREVVGPGGAGDLSTEAREAAFAYIAAHPEVWEVILTGGDPLVLSPRRLAETMTRLAAIEHVKVVRLHTRIPVADPEAVTPERVAALRAGGQAVYVAVHANHPRELTPQARAACARLVDAGVPLLSQSVLLKGVNDDPTTLEQLMRAFVETRIKPYYLHHADTGARGLRRSAPPSRTVRRWCAACAGGCRVSASRPMCSTSPAAMARRPLNPCHLHAGPDGQLQAEAPNGALHPYPPQAQGGDRL